MYLDDSDVVLRCFGLCFWDACLKMGFLGTFFSFFFALRIRLLSGFFLLSFLSGRVFNGFSVFFLLFVTF